MKSNPFANQCSDSETRSVMLPTGVLHISVNKGLFRLDELVGFAARANAKRGFLFLSKVLGKHWPVTPKLMHDIHINIASGVPEYLPGPVLFIAMAETAIGLGQGVFEAYKELNPKCEALFVHTTRYHVGDTLIKEFEESHSHAPRQFLHIPKDQGYRDLFFTARSLVLVDDEASTGNTFVNLANAIRTLNISIERIHLATITNFMGVDESASMSRRLGILTTHGAALTGKFQFTAGNIEQHPPVSQLFQSDVDRGASPLFGRLGVDSLLAPPREIATRLMSTMRTHDRTLVIGTGEFMHMAYLLGCEFEKNGFDVAVQSTTRSPILKWGAVSSTLTFPDNYGEGVSNFIYNVEPGQYDNVFICHETPPNSALFKLANCVGGRLIHFLSENYAEEVPVH